jgi:hypothetical protein
LRHGRIDRQNPPRESGQHVSIDPGAQDGTLRRIPAFNGQRAQLDFRVLDEGLRSGLFLSGLRRTGKTTFLVNDLIPAWHSSQHAMRSTRARIRRGTSSSSEQAHTVRS